MWLKQQEIEGEEILQCGLLCGNLYLHQLNISTGSADQQLASNHTLQPMNTPDTGFPKPPLNLLGYKQLHCKTPLHVQGWELGFAPQENCFWTQQKLDDSYNIALYSLQLEQVTESLNPELQLVVFVNSNMYYARIII